jgi:hypothetical protein
MSGDYRYVTTQLYQSGSTPNPIIGEYPFTRVNFTQQLSSIGTFTGELLLSGIDSSALNVIDGLTPGKVILYVMRGNNPVWSGIIWNRDWDSSTQTIKITAKEMLSYYDHRIISTFTTSSNYTTNVSGTGSSGLSYTNVDALYMLQDLLTAANAKPLHGKTGITYASTNPTTVSGGSSITRAFFDFELKSVYQAWKDLAIGTTYFDFTIKPRLNSSNQLVNEVVVGSPLLGTTYSASSTTSTNLHFPGNVVSYTFVEDGANVGNFLYGIGYGANQNRIISKFYDSNKLVSDTWPLLENTVNFIDVVNPTLLDTFTKGKLAAVSYPPTILQMVIPSYIDPVYNPNVTGFYSIGDGVNVIISDDRFPGGANGIYRIIGIDVEPGENGPDRITLTLNLPLATTLVVG